jgi:hypothetical protein
MVDLVLTGTASAVKKPVTADAERSRPALASSLSFKFVCTSLVTVDACSTCNCTSGTERVGRSAHLSGAYDISSAPSVTGVTVPGDGTRDWPADAE